MARPHLRDPDKERFWRRHLAKWQRNGETVRGYCGKAHLSEASFYSWRAELRRRDQERGTTRNKRRRGKHRSRLFVPVQVQANGTASGIEVVTANGRGIRVGVGFDAATLQRVLAVVEGRPC